MKFRHEFKHSINYSDYLSLRSRLQAVLKPDLKASETGVYIIRSLYFDNADDKVLCEKLDGLNKREKFRLRYYNNDPSYIRLEKKSKMNGLCSKQVVSITKEQCDRLLDGERTFLKESGNPLFLELYNKMEYQQLRPKTIVEYTREAYVFPAGNVRVTIDSNIRTGMFSTDFFNSQLVMLSTAERILEVKYDSFIPQAVSDIIQMSNRKTAGYSKYVACRLY